jgi:hypothetical protein
MPVRDQLPRLLAMALDLFPAGLPLAASALEAAHPAFREMIDFLAGGPAPEQIVGFKISLAAQTRLEELLDKNREDSLTSDEAAELDVYEQVNHVLVLLKARARPRVTSPN